MFNLKTVTTGAAALALMASAAFAETVIRVQSVIPAQADEVTMLKDFAEDVAALTNGSLKIEALPAGAVVGVSETLDAVDSGLIEGGFAWTHYWSGKHPAAMLFGSPVAGAGVGIDNIAFVSWFQYGGGKELYDELWNEMGVNVKGFMLQPVGPEALGWFKEPINSMEDFRKYRFRTPPGIPGQTYKDIGVASVAMGGGDILPALEKGTIDAAEWCCPKPDSVFGFQKVLKHYYFQDLHQVVVNADLYINGDVYNALTPHEQKALEVAATAILIIIMALIFLLGWPLEWVPIVLIIVPILIPALVELNVNLTWFGILVAVNLQTAWLSPPVALSAYFLKGVVPEWDLKDIYLGMMQFMVIQLLGLVLIFVFPQIALWLPSYIYGQ